MGAVESDQREFFMSDEEFRQLSELAYKYTGIVLADHKRDMLYGRLVRRLRELKLNDFKTYLDVLKNNHLDEKSKFINAITTNLTSFFRESHHFDFLASTVCPELSKNKSIDKRIRGWSAGSSTGEEVYSIAMTLKQNLSMSLSNCKLLATDLDSKVLETGHQGVYSIERIENLDTEQRKKWFLFDRNHPDIVKVKPSVQELVSFKRLNLLEKWPMKGPFDFIFCRNVMIYFDQKTQIELVNRFHDMLAPNGYLFIGHSESIHRSCKHFESIGKTIYQKMV